MKDTGQHTVKIYSRSGCHLCEIAEQTARSLQAELGFELEIELIDDQPALIKEFGEHVPVTYIDGAAHDFWRIEPERFRKALAK
jgi:glutaredoxin